jgi:oxalate decarboxylase/phosphoglucose isomerase-like protein (cupin superfamily)
MAQTRRMGNHHQKAQLPNAPRFSPYRNGQITPTDSFVHQQKDLVRSKLKRYKQKPPAMQKLGSGVITTTDDVDRVEFDWGKIHFLSEPAVTNADRFSFGIVELSQGKGHARHNHPGSEEIIYVVSGEGEQMVDDRPPVKVGPGASIYIPADVYHSTVNTGTETLKLIVVYSPAGPERLLREIPGAKVVPAAS